MLTSSPNNRILNISILERRQAEVCSPRRYDVGLQNRFAIRYTNYVVSDVASPISPCGMCRQFIREFCSLDMPILLAASDYLNKEDGVRESTLGELLPYSFGPEDMERERI